MSGAGMMNHMNKTLRQNREMLGNAKEKYKRRNTVKFRADLRLKFKEISPKELAEFKEKIRKQARRKKRIQNTILISIFILTILSAIAVRLMGGFN